MKHGIYRVTAFEIVGPYTLEITFDDHSTQTVNLYPALEGRLYGALRRQDMFKRVTLDPEAHTLVWPNGADFDPETLHDWNQTSWGSGTEASKTENRRVAESRGRYKTTKRR